MCVAAETLRTQLDTDSAQAEENPGFTDGLLSLLEQEQDNAVRLSSKDAPAAFHVPASADACPQLSST